MAEGVEHDPIHAPEHDVGQHYLEVVIRTLGDQKRLAEGAMAQLAPEDFHRQPDPEANSVAIIIKHLRGNMVSRWTDLLTTDGEKASRDRDSEFIADGASVAALMEAWEEGWDCLFGALAELTADDLLKAITIRGEPHSVLEAVERQVAHYGNHVGQIVYLAKLFKGSEWKTLSIPRGRSGTVSPG